MIGWEHWFAIVRRAAKLKSAGSSKPNSDFRRCTKTLPFSGRILPAFQFDAACCGANGKAECLRAIKFGVDVLAQETEAEATDRSDSESVDRMDIPVGPGTTRILFRPAAAVCCAFVIEYCEGNLLQIILTTRPAPLLAYLLNGRHQEGDQDRDDGDDDQQFD